MKQFQKNNTVRLVVAATLVLCAVFSFVAYHTTFAVLGGGGIQQEGGGGGGGGGTVTYACSDGVDNDGNGLIDYPADPGCTSATDTTEAGYTQPPVITQCNDGIDNDGNGPKDYPADLGCTSASDTTEAGYVTTVCSDTIDNDADGKVDLADPGCSSSADTSEDPNPQCSDGKDNDLNGKIDYPADLGCSSAQDNDESGYIPPTTPGSGVIEYSDRPDFIVLRDPAGGTTLGHIDSTYHGSGSSPSVQGTRVCYEVDPTAFESYWEVGGYNSCGDNNMAKWSGSVWSKVGACSDNNHYHILNCTTLAVPDTALTANGSTGPITVTAGTPVKLAWHSTYGQVRKGTFTATNFSMTTTTPAYCEDVQVRECQTCGAGQNCQIAQVQGKENSSQLAFTGTYCDIYWQTNCYPAVTQSQPYDSSTTVTPATPGQYTYTYTGTNGNGSSFKSVTVNVVGTTQCTDGIDNDGDGKIDAQDTACQTPQPPNPGPCQGGCEYDEKPELTAGAITPTTATVGVAVTLSSTITNGGGASTGASFTNLFQRATDSSGTNATAIGTASRAALAASGSGAVTLSYAFPSAATWYVRACADNNSSFVGTIAERDETNNCGAWTAVTVSSPPGGSLSASPTSVVYGNASTLTWSCTNSTAASIDNGIGAVTPVSGGSVSTGALSANKSYTLTCSGTGTPFNAYASVSVTSPSLTFSVNPTTPIRPGGSATITWSTSASAKNCAVRGSDGYSASGYSGNHTFTNIQSQATYTFSCDGSTPSAITISIVPTYKEQ